MSLFSQLTDALTMCTRPDVRPVRTAADPSLEPEEALRLLQAGGLKKIDLLDNYLLRSPPPYSYLMWEPSCRFQSGTLRLLGLRPPSHDAALRAGAPGILGVALRAWHSKHTRRTLCVSGGGHSSDTQRNSLPGSLVALQGYSAGPLEAIQEHSAGLYTGFSGRWALDFLRASPPKTRRTPAGFWNHSRHTRRDSLRASEGGRQGGRTKSGVGS